MSFPSGPDPKPHAGHVPRQVSAITGPHAARWSKQRRFDAAWALIRAVRPASAIAHVTLPLERASEAYEMLDTGGAVAVQLSYDGC